MDDMKEFIDAGAAEVKVYEILTQLLEDGEKIQYDKETDLYLPKGLRRLQWPPKTHVEIKYRLVDYTFDVIRQTYNAVSPDKLVVIYFGEDYKAAYLRILLINKSNTFNNIELVSYSSLVGYIDNPIESRRTQEINQERLKYRAKRSLRRDNVTLFLGAGVSASAGAPAWDNLLEQLCIKKGISKIDTEINSITKGRYVIDQYKKQDKDLNKTDFYTDIKEILYRSVRESQLVEAISKIAQKRNIQSIITYNYDSLIEEEINKDHSHNKCESIYDKKRTSKLPVYHVHGYIAESGEHSDLILGEQEYHDVYAESYNWGNVEQLHALCRTTCFFIGLSMADPNLRRLLDISNKGSDVEPAHYVFLRRIEYNIPFTETIMRGFGVNCIWYDNHEDLPRILEELISLH